MKRAFLVVLTMALVIGLAAPACMAACGCGNAERCGTAGQGKASVCNDGAWKKLGRGAANMLTFSFEIPNQISKVNNSDGPIAAYTWGLLKGIGMTAFRAVVGLYEVVSFPMPCPEGYRPILTEPEFFFEDQIA